MLKRLIFCFTLLLGLSVNVAWAQCLTVSTTQVDVTCFGGNDGQITLNITPGTFPNAQPPYSIDLYYFSGGLTPLASYINVGFTTITFTPGNGSLNLPGADAFGIPATPAGDFYRIDVRSSGGPIICRNKSLLGILISEPTALTASTSQTNVSCFGSNDGTITVTAAGGTGPYQFSSNNGGSFTAGTNPFTFSSLAAGPYNIVVRDANLCLTAPTLVTINQPASVLSLSTTQVNVNCFGGNTGTITVTAVGGTGPYQFSSNNGGSFTAGANPFTFTTLTAGPYNIIVRDANLCTTAATVVTLTQPASGVSLGTTQVNVSCFGGNNGTITVTAAGGTGPYEFSSNNGGSFTAAANPFTFTTLTAGPYNIIVRDANFCTTVATLVTLTQPSAVSLTTSQVNVSCFGGNNGTITVTAAGGIGPYQFSKDNGVIFTPSANPFTFTTLTAGPYNIVVRDASLCTSVASLVTITQPASALSLSTTQVNVNCFGGNTGTITVTAAGGTGPYQFSSNNGGSFTAGANPFTFITLTAGPYNIVVRDANLCTTAVTVVTLTQPASGVSLGTTQVNVSCFGGNNGTITVTAAGGTGPYEFSSNNGGSFTAAANPFTFTTLTAGPYNIIVRDANLCTTVATLVTLTQPSALSLGTTQVNVNCFGGNTGTITVTAAGGIGPYQFSKDNGVIFTPSANPFAFTTLTAGPYNIVVRDANSCITVASLVTITQPASALSLSTTQVNVSCFGGNTGTITVTAAGGTGPYQFSSNNGGSFTAGANPFTFTTLTAGPYNIVIRDANLCATAPTLVTLTQPVSALSFGTTQVNVNCFGSNTGTITVTAAGGTGPYEFSSNNGGSFTPGANPFTFTALTAGPYTVVVRDANLCTTSALVTITQPVSAVTFGTTQVNLICFGGNTGTITVTAAGGTGPYQFSNDNGVSFTPAANPFTFTSLTSGPYNIVVRDASSCSTVVTLVTMTQPSALTLSSTQVNVSCFSGNNGTITVTAAGGTGSYQFSSNNGGSFTAGVNPFTFTTLIAGPYNIVVRDANLCVSAATLVTINQPASALSFGTTQVDVTCFGGNDGSINVTAAGGTGPFEFSSDNGVTFIAGANPFTFTALTAGPYTIVVRDANLCTSPSTLVTLTSNPVITFTATPTVATCLGINDGKIDISGEIGGVGGPFTYSNDGGLSFVPSPNFTSLAPNNYDLVIKDAAGCPSAVATITVVSVTSITITTVNITDASCIGINDGAIDVQLVTGGTGTYMYSLNGGAFAASPIFPLLAVGSYPVVVKDGNGCTSAPQNELVGSTLTITPTVTKTDAACFANNGSIDISPVMGGTTPYQYSIDNGLSFQLSNTFNNLAPSVSPATYKVLVKDVNSCLSTVTDISILQPVVCVVGNCGVFAVTAINIRPTCANKNDGNITLDVSGGTSPYIVTLSRLVAGVPTSPQALPGPGPTFTFINLSPDDYQYSIQDAIGNSCALPYTLLLQESVQAIASNFVDANCFNEPVGQATLTVTSGGTSPYAYSVDNGSNWVAFTSPMIVTNLPPSASPYSILVADDNAGLCSSQVTVTINNASNAPLDTLYVNRTISLPDLATGTMLIGVEESAQEPYEVKIELIQPLFPSQGFLLDWTPIVRNPLNLKFEYDARNLFAGNYQLSLRDNLGCEKSYIVTIKVDTGIAIPNIFTPNGDGVNDVFFIRNLPGETNVLITNRWGKEVYKAGAYQNDWTGGDTSDGIYYYRISASDQVFTGWLEIQRGR